VFVGLQTLAPVAETVEFVLVVFTVVRAVFESALHVVLPCLQRVQVHLEFTVGRLEFVQLSVRVLEIILLVLLDLGYQIIPLKIHSSFVLDGPLPRLQQFVVTLLLYLLNLLVLLVI